MPNVQRNYGGFDYSNYLKTLEIYGTINAENIEIHHKTVDLDHNKLPDPVADAINTLTKHLKENDKHIKILYEKNSICLAEDDEDELDDLLKK